MEGFVEVVFGKYCVVIDVVFEKVGVKGKVIDFLVFYLINCGMVEVVVYYVGVCVIYVVGIVEYVNIGVVGLIVVLVEVCCCGIYEFG